MWDCCVLPKGSEPPSTLTSNSLQNSTNVFTQRSGRFNTCRLRSSAALAAMIQGKYDKKHERRPLAHLLSFGHDEPSSYFRVGIMSKSRWSGDLPGMTGLPDREVGGSDDVGVQKENDPEQVLFGSIPARLAPTPSFHGRKYRLNCRFFAVLVPYMTQHGTGGLRATTAESVIELVDAQDVRALVAGECHSARTSGTPVDRVHYF
jgi:hypothetical protein